MTHISQILLEMLVRDGMSVGSGGTDDTQGIGAGMLEGTAHPLTARAGENREPMGIQKAGAAKAPASALETRKRQPKLGREARYTNGDSFLWLIADNVDVVPTGKRAMPAPFPVCIKGGRT